MSGLHVHSFSAVGGAMGSVYNSYFYKYKTWHYNFSQSLVDSIIQDHAIKYIHIFLSEQKVIEPIYQILIAFLQMFYIHIQLHRRSLLKPLHELCNKCSGHWRQALQEQTSLNINTMVSGFGPEDFSHK